ncbi:MAG: pilus assembly FimT family protein [Thermoguttaceae bacterium]
MNETVLKTTTSPPPRFQSGYTLMEVMIVLAIILIITSVSLPILSNSLSNYRLKKAADLLRSEWTDLRIQAMEQGQIFCFRGMVGGNRFLVDRVLDVHFTAALRVGDEARRGDFDGSPQSIEGNSLLELGFTGEPDDFFVRDPSDINEYNGARYVVLPEGVFISDVLAVPDERAAFYLGFTVGEDENQMQEDPVLNRNTRFGETRDREGIAWSVPIFFFPDGTTSTAAALLKNGSDRCLEVRLRGLTGSTAIGDIALPEQYIGELNPGTIGISQEELDAYTNQLQMRRR